MDSEPSFDESSHLFHSESNQLKDIIDLTSKSEKTGCGMEGSRQEKTVGKNCPFAPASTAPGLPRGAL